MVRYRLAADALAAVHVFYFAAVLVSPWLPWWVHSNLIIAPAWGMAANQGQCRVTQWEYTLRRRYCPPATMEGAVRRLVRWLTLGLWDLGESGGSVLTLAVLVATLVVRGLLHGAAFWQ